ncbi:hypothetical protein [Niveibacterium sp.]|uniref:hypothetical protein n=1 Tax=Niveibacterium sp. TaxID=2017444 RepID=UPI0035AE1505
MTLLQNASATSSAKSWPGGRGSVVASGSFGGATLQLQGLGPDGATWVSVGAALTSAGQTVFEMPPGQIRILVSGGTPSALYAQAARVPV